MTNPDVSIVIVNYNGRRYLEECLEALFKHSDAPIEIIVVDNASTDGSVENLAEYFLEVRLVRNDANLGYSRAINMGVSYARAKYITVLNSDIIVEKNWLSPLIRFLEEHPEVGIVVPCIMLYGSQNKINAVGQNVHVTGLGFNRKLNWSGDRIDSQPVRVSGIQGGAFLMGTDLFRQLGGMNENYFMYHEDVEISLLLSLAGYQIYAVTDSVVYHKYTLHMTPEKLNWLERHRWMTVFSTYSISTLILLLPYLLLTEALMIGYCLTKGRSYINAKLSAIGYVWSHRAELRESRGRMQSVRRISDWQLISGLRWWYDWDQFLTLAKQQGGWLRETLSGMFSRRTYDRIA